MTAKPTKKLARGRRVQEGTLVTHPVFEQRGDTKFFTAFTEDPLTGARRCDREAWRMYWDGLNEREVNSLRRKAEWERMTLMATAIEWGAMDEKGDDDG